MKRAAIVLLATFATLVVAGCSNDGDNTTPTTVTITSPGQSPPRTDSKPETNQWVRESGVWRFTC
ncbi:hypothetical protein [Gordonia sp. ABSL49_1]|uniref:hypothetical protein n=1 Tax=Gordonia sp. ABSL49_1 TaxID=2920941 RepID=UPI001F0DBDCC|nr:hypothetical protein [Gordonia sp. ABSL49_1]MCH5645173.1 hypothetical protein [Gordonia sp. ABSL49_1]